ncbi:hypothetical protein PIB30_087269, partial [Stylosanthes scabra]|nr:hypothetical protein [Stylosanthes scabra]
VSVGAKILNLNSGCSKHMMGDEKSLTIYRPTDGGNIIYGENSKGKVIDIENVDSIDSLTLDSEEKEKIKDFTKETKDDQVEVIESST